MTRKIIALLLTLLLTLTALPAPAETAPAAADSASLPLLPFEPSLQDFLGEWTLLYVIADGAISPDANQYAADALVIRQDGMFSHHDQAESPLFAYTIQGNVLTVDATEVVLAARDLLLVDNEALGTLVYVRTVRPDNPFIGNWRIILLSAGSVTDCSDLENMPALRFGDSTITISDGRTQETLPCVYYNGICTVDPEGVPFSFSIDANGLMTMYKEPYGVLGLLLRVQ